MSVHVSSHPCLLAKLSQIRSHSTTTRETRSLITEISTILGVEALAGLSVAPGTKVFLPVIMCEIRMVGTD